MPDMQPSMTEQSPRDIDIEYGKKARHGHGQDVVDANNVRQVAGCLPIDFANGKIMLISSSKHKNRWVLPKGGWETDETQEMAAKRETWEEAGVKGRITRHLGVFIEKDKQKEAAKAHHWIYELTIDEVCKKFPERKKRERRWFTYDEALLVTKKYIHDAILMSSLNPANAPATSSHSFTSAELLSPHPPQDQTQSSASSDSSASKRKSFFRSLFSAH